MALGSKWFRLDGHLSIYDSYGELFGCVEVLRPSQPNEVMSSADVYLTLLLGRLSPLSS